MSLKQCKTKFNPRIWYEIIIYSHLEHPYTKPNKPKCIRYGRIGLRLCGSVDLGRICSIPVYRCSRGWGGGALERMERELLTRVQRPKALSTQPRLSKIWKEQQMVQKFPGKVSRNSGNCWISKMLTIQPTIPAAKMNGKKTSRKKISKIWVYLPKFVLFIENFGTCCSICHWKLTKIQSWRFGWMERAPKTLLQLAE